MLMPYLVYHSLISLLWVTLTNRLCSTLLSDALPVQASTVMMATRDDPLLSRVLRYVRRGWPDEVQEVLRPHWRVIVYYGEHSYTSQTTFTSAE